MEFYYSPGNCCWVLRSRFFVFCFLFSFFQRMVLWLEYSGWVNSISCLCSFVQALPGQQHCYFLNKDAPLPDGRSLQGTLVSKITFQHPGRVPLILNLIRHQVAYNTLIGSCVKRTILKEGTAFPLMYLLVNGNITLVQRSQIPRPWTSTSVAC